MTREQIRQRVLEVGIVPVIRASSARKAIAAAEAVCAGGIPILEVTMTVPGAFEAIKELTKTWGREILIGDLKHFTVGDQHEFDLLGTGEHAFVGIEQTLGHLQVVRSAGGVTDIAGPCLFDGHAPGASAKSGQHEKEGHGHEGKCRLHLTPPEQRNASHLSDQRPR